MKFVLFCVTFFLTSALFSQNYSRVKIFTGSEGLQFLASQGLAVDHGIYKKDLYFITDLSEFEIQTLQTNGFNFEILISDVVKHYQDQNKNVVQSEKNAICNPSSGGIFEPEVPANFEVPTSYGGFFTYAEMLSELDQMAAVYPSLITVKAPISTFLTAEGRPIYHVKISDNPNVTEAEPAVLYTALHHAREPISMSETIFYMWFLLENYATSPEIAFLLNNTELFFVPCVNPDGYIFNETTNPLGGGMHRKNRNPNHGSFNVGVDLNRNYSYGWNTTGVSSDEDSEVFPGISAFSEPETQAIKWLSENHTFVSASHAHTFGNLMLFPFSTDPSEFADHHDYFNEVGQHMCSSNGYIVQKGSGLYPHSGTSNDYMYMEDMEIGLRDTVFAYTPEIGESFWPPMSDVLPRCQEMVFPNLVLAHMTHKYLVVKEDDASTISSTTGTFHHTVQRLGLIDGPVTVSLIPLLNIQSLGAPVTYNLAIRETDDSNIAFTLTPNIQIGNQVKYIIETDYGAWVDRDTIVKTYIPLTQQFLDNASTNSNWTGGWGLSSAEFYSPANSFADTPFGEYSNQENSVHTYNNPIDLTDASYAKISFYAKWSIEEYQDYCQFQVSTDNGISWTGQCGLYTNLGSATNEGVQPDEEPLWDGIQSSWVREEIDLSDYLGQTIRVRFVLNSNWIVSDDGFFFDDFAIETTNETIGLLENDKRSIDLFPNPSSGVFELVGLEPGANVAIFDLEGRRVKDFKVTNASMKVEMKSQAAGTYFVKTSKEGKEIELKFVLR